MADNRFLARSQQGGMAKPFQPQLQSALMRHAQQRELRPIIVRGAQETLAIELTAHKGEVADQAFDRLFLQSVDGMNRLVQMACQSAGLSPDEPEVKKLCVEATEVLLGELVQFKQEVIRGVGRSMTELATRDPQPRDLDEKKGFWHKFFNEW